MLLLALPPQPRLSLLLLFDASLEIYNWAEMHQQGPMYVNYQEQNRLTSLFSTVVPILSVSTIGGWPCLRYRLLAHRFYFSASLFREASSDGRIEV